MLKSYSPRFRTQPRFSEGGEFLGERVVGFDASGINPSDLAKLEIEINAGLKPLSRDEIIKEISLLKTVTRARESDTMDLKAMLLVYATDLADVPGAALREAILEFRRGSIWFPTVGELREKATANAAGLRAAKTALSARLEHTPKPNRTGAVRGDMTAEERAAFVDGVLKKFGVPNTSPAPIARAQEGPATKPEIKPLHVFNPETAHFGKEPIEQSNGEAA